MVKNSEKGGLSVTCSMTDFSLKFYNRLAIIKHNADPKDFRYEHSRKYINIFIVQKTDNKIFF